MVVPTNKGQLHMMFKFMKQNCGAELTEKAHVIGWVSEGELVICVGIDGWLGKTAQIHVAFASTWSYPPKQMLQAVFLHCFNHCKIETLLGVVNSNNVRALKFDERIGFREIARLPKQHEDGGDMVLLAMKQDECAYMNPEAARAHVHA